MKKLLSVLLALCMLMTVIPSSVFALSEYIVFDGVDGCKVTAINLTQDDNTWLLYDIAFDVSADGRVFTTTKDHPNLIGTSAVLDVTFEGDTLYFNGKKMGDGDAVKLLGKNELIVKDADGNCAEYTVIITEETNGLPVVLIDTLDDVDPSEMTKLEYTDANISVLGGDIYDAKDIYSAVAGIKLRGNSTMGYAKKPFRIKFDKKQEVLGLGKAKSWVLLADYLDPSALRNTVAYHLTARINNYTAEQNGKKAVFAPRMKLVEVYVDGEFMGLYEMGDHMQANEIRVAINELGDEDQTLKGEQIGYFIEVEVKSRVLQEGAEGYADWSAYSYITDVGSAASESGTYAQVINEKDRNNGYLINESDIGKTALYFQFKLPEEPTDAYKAYITEYMQTVNNLILQNDDDVWNYLDMDSVINWYLVNELFKNADSQMQSSVYFYKDGTLDEDGNIKANPDTKLYMAPVWDFDLGAGGVTYGGMGDPAEWRTRNDEYCGWFRELFEMPAFSNAVEARWKELRDTGILGQIFSDIDSFGATAKDAAEDNFALWHDSYVEEVGNTSWMSVPGVSETGDWAAQLTYLSRWLYNRILWMDGEFGYNGASNAENATQTMKDTAVLLNNETMTALTAGNGECIYPIGEYLPLDHLAMNVTVESTAAFDTFFGLRVYTNIKDSSGNLIDFNIDPHFSGDWEPNLKKAGTGVDTVDDARIEADTYTNARITFNGAIVWTLKNNSRFTGKIDTSLSDAEILTTYINKVYLEDIRVTQIDAQIGDTTTMSLETYSQTKSSINDVTATVEKTVIGGAPIIAGAPKVGNTLTLTDLGITPYGASCRYQWYVDDVAVQGATAKTYTVREEDFGKEVSVKSFGLFDYTGNVESDKVTITIDGDQPDAPAAPTLSAATTDSITVVAESGMEYSLDRDTWVTDGMFDDLTPGQCYTVYARVAGNTAKQVPASDASEPLTVMLDVNGFVRGDVNGTGKPDTADAVITLKHALRFFSLKNSTVLAAADYNGDSKITTTDARWILKDIVTSVN